MNQEYIDLVADTKISSSKYPSSLATSFVGSKRNFTTTLKIPKPSNSSTIENTASQISVADTVAQEINQICHSSAKSREIKHLLEKFLLSKSSKLSSVIELDCGKKGNRSSKSSNKKTKISRAIQINRLDPNNLILIEIAPQSQEIGLVDSEFVVSKDL